MRKQIAGAVLVAALASGGTSCSTTTTPSEPETCGKGEGHWIEDDNGFFAETQVTVRLCLSENGQVLDMEVN